MSKVTDQYVGIIGAQGKIGPKTLAKLLEAYFQARLNELEAGLDEMIEAKGKMN